MAVKGDLFDELEVMSSEARRKYQDQKLAAHIDHSYRNAPAARALLEKAGVRPDQVMTVKDLDKLPITRKTDLIEMQKASPPYGGLLAVPTEEVDRVFISPGPMYEPIQHAGIKWFAKAFWAAGFRRGDVVVNTFTYHLSPAGILFHEGLRDCGATVVPMGTGNTDILVQAMKQMKVTGFVGTPSFLMTVLKRIEELGLNLKRDFVLRNAWFTGEMLPPSLRKTLEDDYHIDTAQAYAVTEPGGAIAYECGEKSGMHLMDEYVVEIVDPATGKQVGPGEVGEIVVTPIHNTHWGLIRFGTGDLSSITTEPCKCGRTANRLTGILGRAGDAVKVRGMFIVTKQAEQVVGAFSAIAKFQLVVTRSGLRDDLTLKLELKDESVDRQKLTEDLNNRFQNVCRVKIDRFELVSPGAIQEGQPRLVDQRKWE